MIQTTKVAHRTIKARDLDIFYREAGPKDAPAVLLLHGFPTSSQMFRNLIPALADRYRVLAPDYPGFGHNSMPPRGEFAHTFDNLAGVVEEFTAMLGRRHSVRVSLDAWRNLEGQPAKGVTGRDTRSWRNPARPDEAAGSRPSWPWVVWMHR